MRRGSWFVVLAATLVVPAYAAEAQDNLGYRGAGIRGGLTVDPDQAHVGVHINAGEFAPRVRFQPSIEVGFGSDRVVATFNVDALYRFEARPWVPYLGGGLGVSISDRDDDRGRGDDTDVGAGLNLLGGFEWGESRTYLLEARVGIGDIPEFKLTVGVNF